MRETRHKRNKCEQQQQHNNPPACPIKSVFNSRQISILATFCDDDECALFTDSLMLDCVGFVVNSLHYYPHVN